LGERLHDYWFPQETGETDAAERKTFMNRHLFLILLFALPVFGEDMPDAPSLAYTPYVAQSSRAMAGASRNPQDGSTHRFFDHGNKLRAGILAGLVAADGISTQEILHGAGQWREMDPLARPFVNQGAPGQLAASILGYGFSLGTSYLLHRTGHHKLEKLVLDASIGVEAETVSSNLIWYSTR
jgi:hypothetical protein